MIENHPAESAQVSDRIADAALPSTVAGTLQAACAALEAPDRELDAVSFVARLPHGTAATAVLAPIDRLARDHGCRATVALQHGALEVRLVRGPRTLR